MRLSIPRPRLTARSRHCCRCRGSHHPQCSRPCLPSASTLHFRWHARTRRRCFRAASRSPIRAFGSIAAFLCVARGMPPQTLSANTAGSATWSGCAGSGTAAPRCIVAGTTEPRRSAGAGSCGGSPWCLRTGLPSAKRAVACSKACCGTRLIGLFFRGPRRAMGLPTGPTGLHQMERERRAGNCGAWMMARGGWQHSCSATNAARATSS
mmetsp:Transcript_28374/g.91584  ORF Transcript_28374/g.91584 Transcript_28374/m.91584 type:complete len:209 (-) Transcript_28374:180-806(-)